jgi:hypothetical protein
VLFLDPLKVELSPPPSDVEFPSGVNTRVPFARTCALARVPLSATAKVAFNGTVELLIITTVLLTATSRATTGVIDHGALTNDPNRERGYRLFG